MMTSPPPKGYHDIGGLPAGTVERMERPFEPWHKKSEALRGVLEAKGRIVSLDEIRRVFETFGKPLYDTLGFYERRAEALTRLLDEKGVVSAAEVRARMETIAAERRQRLDHDARAVHLEEG